MYASLTVGASWHKPDHYFIFRDIEEFYQALLCVNKNYADRTGFAKKQLINSANSYYFTSDLAIEEYAENIWGLL